MLILRQQQCSCMNWFLCKVPSLLLLVKLLVRILYFPFYLPTETWIFWSSILVCLFLIYDSIADFLYSYNQCPDWLLSGSFLDCTLSLTFFSFLVPASESMSLPCLTVLFISPSEALSCTVLLSPPLPALPDTVCVDLSSWSQLRGEPVWSCF